MNLQLEGANQIHTERKAIKNYQHCPYNAESFLSLSFNQSTLEARSAKLSHLMNRKKKASSFQSKL